MSQRESRVLRRFMSTPREVALGFLFFLIVRVEREPVGRIGQEFRYANTITKVVPSSDVANGE